MKNIYCIFLSLLCLNVFGQKTIDQDWKRQINNVFSGLDKSRVPTGVLLDYAMEFTNVQAYNGVLTDSTTVNADVMGNIYKTLFMGKVSADTTYFPRFESYANAWAMHRLESNAVEQNTLVLGGLLYNYAKIDSTALINNKITVLNNIYYDKFTDSQWQNPYVTDTVIAIAPPLSNYNLLEFNVILPRELFISNLQPDLIASIDADFNDGLGYRHLLFNQQIQLKYKEQKNYTWLFKISLHNGAVLYSASQINLSHAVLPVVYFGNNIKIPGHNGTAGAILRFQNDITRSNRLVRPLIVVEGFDPGTVLTPEVPGGDLSLIDFMSTVGSVNRSGDLSTILNSAEYDLNLCRLG